MVIDDGDAGDVVSERPAPVAKPRRVPRQHHYHAGLRWTGNRGTGTDTYTTYSRDHELLSGAKPVIMASSDPAFRGDATRWNPEEMLVAALASCHQLWYLHLCAAAGIVVTAYEDDAEGVMEETGNGGGRFVRVVLHPTVTITDEARREEATALHEQAHHLCFIAQSVNFRVAVEGVVRSIRKPTPARVRIPSRMNLLFPHHPEVPCELP